MSQHRYWVQHTNLSNLEWFNIVQGMNWMLENCPEKFDGPGGRYPIAPLRGSLITANFVLDGDQGKWDGISRLRHDGTGSPISDVLDKAHIVLNGHASFGADYFVLGHSATGKPQVIDTEGKPYELLVIATLILANHLQPSNWTIETTAPREAWEAALAFLRGYMADAEIPANIQRQWERQIGIPSLTIPPAMDFRA